MKYGFNAAYGFELLKSHDAGAAPKAVLNAVPQTEPGAPAACKKLPYGFAVAAAPVDILPAASAP